MKNREHFSFEQLTDYVEGRTEPKDVAEIDAHLATGCEVCAHKMAFISRFHGALQADGWEAPPTNVRRNALKILPQRAKTARQPIRLRVSWAFSVITILVVLLLVFRPTMAYAATLGNVLGTVEVRQSQNSAWQPATIGQTISAGDEIRTGDDGQVTLNFANGSRIQLTPNAVLQLSRLVNSDQSQGVVLTQVTGAGEFWLQNGTGEIQLRSNGWVVTTNDSHFHVDVQSDGTTVVDVQDGNIDAESDNGTVHISDGQQIELSPQTDSTTSSDSTPSIATETQTSGSDSNASTPQNGEKQTDTSFTATPSLSETPTVNQENSTPEP